MASLAVGDLIGACKDPVEFYFIEKIEREGGLRIPRLLRFYLVLQHVLKNAQDNSLKGKVVLNLPVGEFMH